ncbi:MAG: hypothetical protein ABI635_02785 [Actinomycetota bacterium]
MRAALTFALLSSLLVAIPAAVQTASAAETTSAAPSIFQTPKVVSVPPLTLADHDPISGPVATIGTADPLQAAPDFSHVTSPKRIEDSAIPVPDPGAMQMDVFSPGAGVGDHMALLSSDIFNVQQADGDWVDGSLTPLPTPKAGPEKARTTSFDSPRS